jgi:protein Mpv17
VRTARLAFYGGCVFGPPVATWFGFLGRLQFSSPAKGVVYRVRLRRLRPRSLD